jgi:hypothetical protein
LKILFVMIGPVSFKSASFVRNFIKQIDTQVHSLYVMAENFTFAYLQANKKFKFLSMSSNFNEAILQDYLAKKKFDLIFFVNLDILLFDDTHVAFKKRYLNHINTRVLFFVTNSQVIFSEGYAELSGIEESKTKINFPFSVLKSCPPFIPDTDFETEMAAENNENERKKLRTYYWKNLESFAFLSKYDSRDQLKDQLLASEESKIVSLIFDYEHVYIAGNAGLFYHYKILIECVYHYLASLKVPCNLMVGNLTPLKIEQYSPDVKIYFYSLLQEEDFELTIRATDLVITESIADTSLIDAANLKVPVINLKNTLMLDRVKDDEDNDTYDIVYNFDELTDFARSKVEDLIVNCPGAIFPYYAFPNAATMNVEDTKVFGHYIFNFSELFDEKQTTGLISDLLLNEEAIKEELYRIEQYLALRADALDAMEILESI